MKKARPVINTVEDLEKAIIERPVYMFFRMRTGLMYDISENGALIWDTLVDIADNFAVLIVYMLIAIIHMAKIIVYPIYRTFAYLIIWHNLKTNSGRVEVTRKNIENGN